MMANIPRWEEKLMQSYYDGAAHAFILHGNVLDYVVPGVRLKTYLGQRNGERPLVVFYNPSQGIRFGLPQMENIFRKALGMDGSQSDPALASLGLASDGPPPLPVSPGDALPLLEKMLTLTTVELRENGAITDELFPPKYDDLASEMREPACALIIEYPEGIVPNGDIATMSPVDRLNLITLSRWGYESAIEQTGNIVYVLTQTLTQIHSNLRAASKKWEVVTVPLPTSPDRINYINLYVDGSAIEFKENGTPFNAEIMGNLTAGLSLVHIEDILLRGNRVGFLTKEIVQERKRTIIESEFAGLVETPEPKFGFSRIANLDNVKEKCQRSIINAITAGKFYRVPMGMLMTGPPGTGKSVFASALAYETGFNYIQLRIGRLLGQYVGNSEANLERVLGMIETMTPVVVFIDEIDQSTGRGGSGESDVNSRIFQRLLEFVADTSHRGKVIWLGATNRPDNIDPALKRAGRLGDIKMLFPAPQTDAEREGMFKVMFSKYDITPPKAFKMPLVCLEKTAGWVGSDIEVVVRTAKEIQEDYGHTLEKALIDATERILPSTSGVEFMTNLGLAEISDLDLLPQGELRDRFLKIKSGSMPVVTNEQKLEMEAPGFRKGRR